MEKPNKELVKVTRTIDDIFKEAYRQIETYPEAKNIDSIKKKGITLYSYQSFRERKNNELFEIGSHFNSNTLKDKLECFVKKEEIVVKGKKVYYPSLEIPFETSILQKEFYEKTKSFLKNFKYDLHRFSPFRVLYEIMSRQLIKSRRKYGYELEFFFNSKEDSRKLVVMGSIYKKDGKRYLSLTSESEQQIKKYAKKIIDATGRKNLKRP